MPGPKKSVRFNEKSVANKNASNRVNWRRSGKEKHADAIKALLYMFSYTTNNRKLTSGIKAAGKSPGKFMGGCPTNKPYIRYSDNKMRYYCNSTPNTYVNAHMRMKKMKRNFNNKVNKGTVMEEIAAGVPVNKRREKNGKGAPFVPYFQYFMPIIKERAAKELKKTSKKPTKMYSEPKLKRTKSVSSAKRRSRPKSI